MVDIGVQVIVDDAALRRALARRIARAPGFAAVVQASGFDDIPAGKVVLTTPSDCSLAQCEELERGGVPVVLLAPVPREAERANYLLVGARYLVMSVDTEELFTALREAAGAKSMRVTEGSPGC